MMVNLIKVTSVLLIFFPSVAFGFNLAASASGGNGSWSNGVYEAAKGASVSFNVTASGGTGSYAYCWDFGTSVPADGSQLGQWNSDHKQICYSTSQTPSHTFSEYGEYEVWVAVTDSAVPPVREKALLMVRVDVGGTTVNAKTGCGANNLTGDGTTDEGTKLAACVNAIMGDVTVQFPAGNYLFSQQNSFTGGKSVQLEPEDGATVNFVLDPAEDADMILHLDNDTTDASGNQTVTVQNAPVFRADDRGAGTHALELDGTNQYLEVDDHPELDFSGGNWTIHALINVDNRLNEQVIYYQESTVGTNYLKFYVDTDGALKLSIFTGGNESLDGGAGMDTLPNKIQAGQWYRVVARSHDGTLYLHITQGQQAVDYESLSDPDVPIDFDKKVLIGYDGTSYFDGKIDEVVVSNATPTRNPTFVGGTRYFKNINVIRKLEASEYLSSARRASFTAGKAIIHKCNFDKVEGISDNPSGYVYRSNIADWGMAFFTERDAFAGIVSHMYFRQLYVASDFTSAHFYYGSPPAAVTTYFVDNYLDHHTMKTGSLNLIPGEQTYIYHNYMTSVHETLNWGGSPQDNVEILDNVFDRAWIHMQLAGATNVKINGNGFYNTTAFSDPVILNSGNTPVQIQNNTFGTGSPAGGGFKLYVLQGDTCNEGGGEQISDPNPNVPGDAVNVSGCGYATWAGNVDNNDPVPISDPGLWEFIPPVIASASYDSGTLTVAVNDNLGGSGLGTTARFPFSEGAFIQVADASNNYSEIKAYSTTTDWTDTPAAVRVADVDHNLAIFGVVPPEFLTQNIQNGIDGEAYSVSLQARGMEPITWSLQSGSLPAGLSLSANGTIAGTPTAEGVFTFTVKVTDINLRSSTKEFTLIIDAAGTTEISVKDAVQNSTVTMSTSTGDLQNVQAQDQSLLSAPSGFNFPYGLVGFQIINLPSAGATATVTFDFADNVDTSTKWYWYNSATSQWRDISNDVNLQINGSAVQVTLKDNTPAITGIGDSDSVAQQITDPSGPAVPPAVPPVVPPVVTPASSSGGGSGCFIATAAFGSPMSGAVKILKEFRNVSLESSRWGRKVVALYYRWSPFLADRISRSKVLKAVTRIALMPAVGFGWAAVKYGVFPALFLMTLVVLIAMLSFYFILQRTCRIKRYHFDKTHA